MAMTRDCFEPASASFVLGSPPLCRDGFAATKVDGDVAVIAFCRVWHRDPPFGSRRRRAAPPKAPPRRPAAGQDLASALGARNDDNYRSNWVRLPVVSDDGRNFNSATFDRTIGGPAFAAGPLFGHLTLSPRRSQTRSTRLRAWQAVRSPPSPTTKSRVRGDFLNRRQMPAIGGLSF